jgi:hypothetical protein
LQRSFSWHIAELNYAAPSHRYSNCDGPATLHPFRFLSQWRCTMPRRFDFVTICFALLQFGAVGVITASVSPRLNSIRLLPPEEASQILGGDECLTDGYKSCIEHCGPSYECGIHNCTNNGQQYVCTGNTGTFRVGSGAPRVKKSSSGSLESESGTPVTCTEDRQCAPYCATSGGGYVCVYLVDWPATPKCTLTPTTPSGGSCPEE